MLLFHIWVQRFAGRVPCPFPAVPHRHQVLPHCLRRDLEAALGRQDVGQLYGGPQPVVFELDPEHRFLSGLQLDGASSSRGIADAPQATLLEARQIIVDALFGAREMNRQARHGPAFAVKSQQTRPKAHFGMNPRPEFQRLELGGLCCADLNPPSWSSHLSKV